MRILNLRNKKAQSQVITTILIILLVLVVIIIVYNIVKRTIEKSSSEVGTEQFAVSLSASTANFSEDSIEISVSRGAGKGNITALKFIFKDVNGNTKEIERNISDGYQMPLELETKTYTFSKTEIGFTPVSYDVYPIIQSGGKEIIGLKASKKGVSETTGAATYIGLNSCRELNESGKTYLLKNNLINISGTCFTILADNITLNLNSHSIRGDDSGVDYGIDLQNHNKITIKNGEIYDFYNGIYLSGSANNNINGITTNSNTNYGIFLEIWSKNNQLTSIVADNNKNAGIFIYDNSNYNVLTTITANSNYYGIRSDYSSYNNLTQITANSNYDGVDDGYGIYFTSSSNNIFTDITANSNYNNGIYLSSSSNNKLIGTTSNSNRGIGINLESSSNNRLTDITANNNTHGIQLFSASNNNQLTSITANFNLWDGIAIVISSNNNILTNINSSLNSRFGSSLWSSSNNSLTDITSNSNTMDGIYLSSSSNNTLQDITANSNSNTGIYLLSSLNNNLTGITANLNTRGLHLAGSENNYIQTNTIKNNTECGVYLAGTATKNNKIISNYVCGNTDNIGTDYDFYCFAGANTYTSNQCSKKVLSGTGFCSGLTCSAC